MNFLSYVNSLVQQLSGFMWGPATIFLILGVGLFLTILFGFFQIFYCKDILKNTIGSLFSKNTNQNKGISAFEAVSTALAGSLGTGNIIGVATAMCSGGPGAIFWMWVSAFLGTSLKFAEVVLALAFRVSTKDGYVGGAMYVLERGLNCKFLGKVFALFCILASFGIGSTTQSNSAVLALEKGFYLPKIVSSIAILLTFTIIVIGGIKRIGIMASKVVPLMSIIYIVFSSYIIIKNFHLVGPAFRLIFEGAFNFRAAVGGQAGYFVNLALKYGIARSVFISEAGLGSAPIAHAASNLKSPVKQGEWGIFEVVFNTIIMCTMTALVILVTETLTVSNNAADVALMAFSKELGPIAGIVLAICLALFAFTTTMSWAYYGEQSVNYCFGEKYVKIYRVIYIFSIGLGGMCTISFVWQLADIFNALMVFPNLISIVGLSPVLYKIVKEYKLEIKKPKSELNVNQLER